MVMENPLENLKKYSVVLASGSPRRRELLAMMGVEFDVRSVDVDETYPAHLAPEDVAPYLSELKARHYRDNLMQSGQLVITADTVVIAQGRVLGKPVSKEDAVKMLRMLSGSTHQVVTGVSVCADLREISTISVSTQVTFASLTDSEIDYYVERYRPMDKAGAYGIQEWIGCIGISSIQGSFYNVMGLPTHRLYQLLAQKV